MKILDITEKLSFEGRPILKVKDLEIEVNNDAINVLSIMELMDANVSNKDMADAAKLLFGEEGYKKIKKLKLNFEDFSVLLNHAMDLATGESSTGE